MSKNKKNRTGVILVIVLLVYFYFFFICFFKNPPNLNREICDFAAQEVKGVLEAQGGHGIYQWIKIDNVDYDFSIGISKILYTKYITNKYVDMKIGDSLIKEANSKEFTIVRGDSMAVYLLKCED